MDEAFAWRNTFPFLQGRHRQRVAAGPCGAAEVSLMFEVESRIDAQWNDVPVLDLQGQGVIMNFSERTKLLGRLCQDAFLGRAARMAGEIGQTAGTSRTALITAWIAQPWAGASFRKYVGFILVDNREEKGLAPELSLLCVRTEYRRRGAQGGLRVGARLLAWYERMVAAHGLLHPGPRSRLAFAEVLNYGGARTFYLRHGWSYVNPRDADLPVIPDEAARRMRVTQVGDPRWPQVIFMEKWIRVSTFIRIRIGPPPPPAVLGVGPAPGSGPAPPPPPPGPPPSPLALPPSVALRTWRAEMLAALGE